MAKNTSKKSAKKNTALFQKFISSKWYIKTLIIIVVAVLGFMIFKKCINTYNISLLDKAEAKMRAMDLPKADTTEYRRSCSFRSVKFGSAGSPNCDVVRTDTYKDISDATSIAVATSYLQQYINKYPDNVPNYENNRDFLKRLGMVGDSTPYIDLPSLQKGLNCYVRIDIDNNKEDLKTNELNIITSCYKEFMFQTYPELN